MGWAVVNATDKTRLLQHIQNEQGYVVIGWNEPLQVGDLFPRDGRPIFGLEYEEQPDLVVIAVANDNDLWRQAEQYYPVPPMRVSWTMWKYHYKVTAE